MGSISAADAMILLVEDAASMACEADALSAARSLLRASALVLPPDECARVVDSIEATFHLREKGALNG